MKIVRGILAIVVGILAGSIVNGGLLLLFFAVFGAPEGLNIFDAESVKANADNFTTANFIGTLLTHQLATMVGAFVAARIAPAGKMIFAIAIGIWFLLGGVYAAAIVSAPIWFVVADLALYIPVAFIGGKLGGGGNK
jgi:hypothetical protein